MKLSKAFTRYVFRVLLVELSGEACPYLQQKESLVKRLFTEAWSFFPNVKTCKKPSECDGMGFWCVIKEVPISFQSVK